MNRNRTKRSSVEGPGQAVAGLKLKEGPNWDTKRFGNGIDVLEGRIAFTALNSAHGGSGVTGFRSDRTPHTVERYTRLLLDNTIDIY